MRPIVKPLASKHHGEIQLICDRACARWASLTALETAFAAGPTRDELADLAFAWSTHVMALGNWGWWSVSPDGRLNPALVAWNKSWFLVPIDVVLDAHAQKHTLAAVLDRVRSLSLDSAGALSPFATSSAVLPQP